MRIVPLRRSCCVNYAGRYSSVKYILTWPTLLRSFAFPLVATVVEGSGGNWCGMTWHNEFL